ncbi:XdhC family protein [Saccharomonospora sp. NPDC046836]|uniref:XdhC family protein n=1 Tax=Saccharomonospora sp. NPDC046836 TaxID=3156921 RepID=UPI0033DAD5BB
MTSATPALLAHAEELRAERTPFVLATVVRAQRPTSARPGDRALVFADGTIEGFVGGTCAESTVRLQGMRLLATGESTLLRITPEVAGETAGEGIVTIANPCLSGGTVEIFLEPQLPPALVEVFGDAPIARALRTLGTALGYEVRFGRPEAELPADTDAVIVASHGHDEDMVLRAALAADIGYIGLIASPRRGRAVLAALDMPGVERIHTPAGLDIGARTAEEIALSVYAELIAIRPRRHPADSPEPAAAPAEATDPVCGMRVAVTVGALQSTHAGRVHYFCGPGCQQAFIDDPARYLTDV